MKKKRSIEKLTLNRETVRLLDERGTSEALGGASTGAKCSICTYVCSGCRPCL